MENPAPKKKNKILPVILVIIIFSALFYGGNKYIYSLHHEDTDDAQIDGDISPVIARVGGYVTSIRFEDNQQVKKGDTLALLDDRDMQIKVQQAEAAVKTAEAGVAVAQATQNVSSNSITVAQSAIDAAKIRVWKAVQDFNRYSNLLKVNSVTQQQFDAAKAEKESAETAMTTAQNQLQVVKQQAGASSEQIKVAAAQLAQRAADLDFAKLQLSYYAITAPANGYASKKNIQPGQLINVGSPLCAIVSNDGTYVMANFKETQLEKMKEGQSVEVTSDAYPNEPVKGTLYRFSSATGAKFSLLPPDNATGNFVKVVQRVPVKIKLDSTNALVKNLRPGMSVKVAVAFN